MKINDSLKTLASLIAPYAPLYAVGGCVRDSLLGIDCYDIDICSKLEVKDIKKILLNTQFGVSDKNLRMGTVIIHTHGFRAEYTTFRVDSYDTASGAHTPDKVQFTSDMRLDALRRDFKCNALYFDIVRECIVDVLGGEQDIQNRVLSSADEPDRVFEADGLRILRLVRFAAELGFDIEPKTLASAKANAWRVKDIVAERVRDELNRIFTADIRHTQLSLSDAHYRGLKLLDELGLIDMLLGELSALKGLEQPKKYHLYDAYNHSVETYRCANASIRWAALLHDVGKARAVELNGNMHGHDALGAELCADILKRLKFPPKEANRICRLVRYHMMDINGNESMNKLRRFAAENSDIVEDLCALMDADGIASGGEIARENRLRAAYYSLIADGTPMSIAQMKIDGKDLIALGVEECDRGRIMKELWSDTVLNPSLNDRDKALEYVKRKVGKYR